MRDGRSKVVVTIREELLPGQGPIRHRSISATFTLSELRRAIESGRAVWGKGGLGDVEAMFSVRDKDAVNR